MREPTDAQLDEWAAIEEAGAERDDARGLFHLAMRAHEFAMRDLLRTERALCFAIRRAQRSRRHAERAGRLLINAMKLVELTR